MELLITLLSNSNADVNFETTRSMTALHFAVEVRNIWMLAFSIFHILICVRISLWPDFITECVMYRCQKEDLASLVPRPSTPPVFDRLQYAYCKRSKTGGVEGLGTRLLWALCAVQI